MKKTNPLSRTRAWIAGQWARGVEQSAAVYATDNLQISSGRDIGINAA